MWIYTLYSLPKQSTAANKHVVEDHIVTSEGDIAMEGSEGDESERLSTRGSSQVCTILDHCLVVISYMIILDQRCPNRLRQTQTRSSMAGVDRYQLARKSWAEAANNIPERYAHRVLDTAIDLLTAVLLFENPWPNILEKDKFSLRTLVDAAKSLEYLEIERRLKLDKDYAKVLAKIVSKPYI